MNEICNHFFNVIYGYGKIKQNGSKFARVRCDYYQPTTDTNGEGSELILSTLHQQFNQKKDQEDDEEKKILGYFYAQIVTYSSSSDDDDDDDTTTRTVRNRCFLYKHVSTNNTIVPVQFGREVVATVLDQPNLANWKSYTVSKQEEENTIHFRKLLSSSMEPQPPQPQTQPQQQQQQSEQNNDKE